MDKISFIMCSKSLSAVKQAQSFKTLYKYGIEFRYKEKSKLAKPMLQIDRNSIW